MEIFGTYPAQTSKPPKKMISMIKKKRPEWGEGK
jgi:sarcosine oxidase subunit delta